MQAHALMDRAVRLQQAGRTGEASEIYREVLRAEPGHFGALYMLGVITAQSGRLAEGERLIGEALARGPSFPQGWAFRGMILKDLGRHTDALAAFDRALAFAAGLPEAEAGRAQVLLEMKRPDEAIRVMDRLVASQPGVASHWNNRGNVLIALDRPEEALSSFDRALALDPKRASALSNRGTALLTLKRFEEAFETFERLLVMEPNFAKAEEHREIALFELKRTTRCPPGFMRDLFDEFSSYYDDRMLDKLGYRAHRHLRTLVDRVLPNLAPPLRILDLGSGTGLVGDAFKDLAAGGRLDGIDIAPKMIEVARARGIYDDLILGDLETVLAAPGPPYDLVLAADTMIYFGELGPTLAGVAARLAPGGHYAFAVEAKSGAGWEQTEDRRFRHSDSYLREAAARADLPVRDIMDCTLRHQANVPVAGFAVMLQRPAG